jgi:hypothetical protein
MLSNGSNLVRTAVALTMLVVGAGSEAFASPVDCYDRVLANCDDALEAASWWEKPAVGIFCTGMLAGCVGDGWFS